MATYLPKDTSPGSAYQEGGGLYALGLIHANHGGDIIDYLLSQLKNASNDVSILMFTVIQLLSKTSLNRNHKMMCWAPQLIVKSLCHLVCFMFPVPSFMVHFVLVHRLSAMVGPSALVWLHWEQPDRMFTTFSSPTCIRTMLLLVRRP